MYPFIINQTSNKLGTKSEAVIMYMHIYMYVCMHIYEYRFFYEYLHTYTHIHPYIFTKLKFVVSFYNKPNFK
jgi:hypothetical protein